MSNCWSRKGPTKPGYYWFRQGKGQTPCIVEFNYGDEGELVDQDGASWFYFEGQLAGPIPLPKEKKNAKLRLG